MFDLDSLFLENSFDDVYDTDATTRTTEEGFVWCDCNIDESKVIDGDPFDFITESMYQNVINANNINMAILADRYAYLKENGYEMVYEAEEQKQKKSEAIAAFFKKVKERIIQFFETVVAKMHALQTKFLMLFKKAKERGGKGFAFLDDKLKSAPAYTPQTVVGNARAVIKGLEKAERDTDKGFTMPDTKLPTSFDKELDIVKNYGNYIKEVKKMRKDAEQAIDTQKKKALFNLADDATNDDKKTLKEDYAKRANAVASVSRSAISLIMKRVNTAATIVNKSVFVSQKDGTKSSKNESTSYLGRLQMI